MSGFRSSAVFGLRRPRFSGVCLVEIELRNRPGNLSESQYPELLPAIHQPLDLIKLLKIR
jgi:hypothetical protein